MALFRKSHLIAYRKRIELQLSILELATAFNESEKQNLANIYLQLIAIYDKAIARNTEKDTKPFQAK